MAKTILIVDDDQAVLRSYERLLRRLGHRILLANDSDRVRVDARSLEGVDLLILDQRMPRTSGLDLLSSLRRRVGEGGQAPVVLLISAYLSQDLRDRAAHLGVAEVIEKPVDTRRLLESVRAVLGDNTNHDGTSGAGPSAARP